MNVFCKLNRITFHFFNLTLSLSSRQLAILLLRCSPNIPFVNSITFSLQTARPPHPAALIQLCPHLFCTSCLPLHYHQSTLLKHATTTRPPQKHTLYNARVRERKKDHNVSTPRPALRENHPPTPFAHSHQCHKSKL